jgi:hypothetical protein
MGEPAVQYMAALDGAFRAGYTAPVTNDVQNVTTRHPITFEQFTAENAACST